MDNALHSVQTLFMRRQGGGLRNNTERQVALRKFGCQPFECGWLAALGLWDRICQLREEHMMRAVVAEGMSALGGGVGCSWLCDFATLLSMFDALPEAGLFAVSGVWWLGAVPVRPRC